MSTGKWTEIAEITKKHGVNSQLKSFHPITTMHESLYSVDQDVSIPIIGSDRDNLSRMHSRLQDEFLSIAKGMISPKPWEEDEEMVDINAIPAFPAVDPRRYEDMDEKELQDLVQRMQIVDSINDNALAQLNIHSNTSSVGKSAIISKGVTSGQIKGNISDDDKPDPSQPFRVAKETPLAQRKISLGTLRIPEFGTKALREEELTPQGKTVKKDEKTEWKKPEPRTFADKVARIREVVLRLPNRYMPAEEANIAGVDINSMLVETGESTANQFGHRLQLKSALQHVGRIRDQRRRLFVFPKSGWSQSMVANRRSRNQIKEERRLRQNLRRRQRSTDYDKGLLKDELEDFENFNLNTVNDRDVPVEEDPIFNEEDDLLDDDEALRIEIAKSKGPRFSAPDLMQLPLVRDLGRGWTGVLHDPDFLFTDWAADPVAEAAEELKELVAGGAAAKLRLNAKKQDKQFAKLLLNRQNVFSHTAASDHASLGATVNGRSSSIGSPKKQLSYDRLPRPLPGGGTGGAGARQKPHEDYLRLKAEVASLNSMWMRARRQNELKARGTSPGNKQELNIDTNQNSFGLGGTLSLFRFSKGFTRKERAYNAAMALENQLVQEH